MHVRGQCFRNAFLLHERKRTRLEPPACESFDIFGAKLLATVFGVSVRPSRKARSRLSFFSRRRNDGNHQIRLAGRHLGRQSQHNTAVRCYVSCQSKGYHELILFLVIVAGVCGFGRRLRPRRDKSVWQEPASKARAREARSRCPRGSDQASGLTSKYQHGVTLECVPLNHPLFANSFRQGAFSRNGFGAEWDAKL